MHIQKLIRAKQFQDASVRQKKRESSSACRSVIGSFNTESFIGSFIVEASFILEEPFTGSLLGLSKLNLSLDLSLLKFSLNLLFAKISHCRRVSHC